jgi:predicted nucleotide-binding protein
MQFARDFTSYFGNFDNSPDIPATSASVWESILDFEDLRHAWREELDRRAPAPVITSPVLATVREGALSSIETLSDKTKRVFVIHGRDERLRVGVFTFLRALGLEPLEWIKAIQLTGKPSPFIGEILDAAFKHAQAAVVLLTPDDEARLREDFVQPSDPPYEKVLTGQARPNVLFEAGMAFASHPNETVLVQFGNVKPFSDVAGRHVVHMDNSGKKRQELASKLRTAGCSVDMDGSDWHSDGDLKPPPLENKTLSQRDTGTLLGNPKSMAAESKLGEFKRILISPISRGTGETEYTLEKVDETGAVIQLGNGLFVHIPRADYHESWDFAKQKPKLILTRKYFQGYFPGHESAEEYFLPR